MPKKRILIIDDDEDFVESTRVVLESKGYSVFSAESKERGLNMARQTLPDIIIMDVMLEKMSDGFDLTRKLKSSEKYKNIPILMITSIREKTGFRFSAAVDDQMWLPVDDYAEKPLKPDELLSRIEKLLREKDKKND